MCPDLSQPRRSRITTLVGTSRPVTAGLPGRQNDRVYTAGGLLAVLGGLVGMALHAVNAAAGRTVTPSFWLMQVAVAVAYGLLALAVRRAATVWLRSTVLLIALFAAVSVLASEWAQAVPGSDWMLWLGSWSWAPGYVAILALLPGLLPDGQVPSPRWRAVPVLGLAAVVLAGGSWALTPYDAQDFPGPLAGSTNPVGVDLMASAPVQALVLTVTLLAAGSAVAALVVRWHRAEGVARQQLKWVLLGVAATLALAALARVLPVPITEAVAAAAMLPLPAAVAVAVLRFGLWDVEVVVSRTLVYVSVSVVAVVGYAGVVGLVDLAVDGASGAAALIAVAVVAPLMPPLHRWLQRRVNRRVHGDDDEPWDELARLGERLAAAADPDELVDHVLPSVVGRIGHALRASGLRLRLPDGSVLVEGVEPAGGDESAVELPLEYAGERLGTLTVARAGGFGSAERAQLDRLAAQAAVAVHTVMLARETRRSRELVVVAREEERRRLRRDLHDGVGPSIAALALQVETARDLAAEDPEAAGALLARLAPRINAVVGDVRALVHELRPPTLDELGLAAAVRELAARLSGTTTVTVQADDLGALPAAVEVATYRITGEAVTNAVRHSGAKAVAVSVVRDDECLLVTVRDDGHGLRQPTVDGVGLGSMRARTEELGGTFTLVTGETGTTVAARLPLQDVGREDRRTA